MASNGFACIMPPNRISMDVLDLMKKEPKICNYIDIPLQHISDSVLKSSRNYPRKRPKLLRDFVSAFPEWLYITTLIVGYPGETQEDFNILKDWVQEMKFDRMGCFAYSHEEKTHAYLLEDDVPDTVKQERAKSWNYSHKFHGFKTKKKNRQSF
jgi:ribosomal protein S12 methylthiotransferase